MDPSPVSPPRASTSPRDRGRVRLERFVLAWSPIWIAAVGIVAGTNALAHWGEIEYLGFGIALAAPLWIAAVVRPAPSERDRPLADRAAVRFQIAIAITVFLQSALGTQLFFHRLGMEYHFPVRASLAGTPVFLYFVTVAYFSTYYVVMTRVLRIAARLFPRAPRPLRLAARFALCAAVAFAETFFMASDALRDYFRYRDLPFMLVVGSACYGSLFFLTLPVFERLEARPDRSLRAVVLDAVLANALALAVYGSFALVLPPR